MEANYYYTLANCFAHDVPLTEYLIRETKLKVDQTSFDLMLSKSFRIAPNNTEGYWA